MAKCGPITRAWSLKAIIIDNNSCLYSGFGNWWNALEDHTSISSTVSERLK